LVDQYKNSGLVVLGINAWDEPSEQLRNFAKQNSLKQKILLNGSEVKERYGVESVPMVFWIDENGIITDLELGFDSAEELRKRTERLLKGRS